jgi:putative IMPACT (imprinted ancient) family translation regulator
MQELAAVKLTVQHSRFFAHLYKIEKTEEIADIIKSNRKSYKKANHHCYALRLFNNSNKQIIESFKDDGEVGQPGRVLLEILKKHNLNQHALIVSRIFGGIKLGVGGVSRAFRDAGEGVVEQYNHID